MLVDSACLRLRSQAVCCNYPHSTGAPCSTHLQCFQLQDFQHVKVLDVTFFLQIMDYFQSSRPAMQNSVQIKTAMDVRSQSTASEGKLCNPHQTVSVLTSQQQNGVLSRLPVQMVAKKPRLS